MKKMNKYFRFRNRQLECKNIPLIMGIVNATPDSFSDGNCFYDLSTGYNHAVSMIKAGVDIIDIGGESTRPGAETVTIDEEINRVVPLIKKVKQNFPKAVVSIDSRKSEVAREALFVGADIINDISGLEYSATMVDLAVEFDAGLMIMHMRGTPQNMLNSKFTKYDTIDDEVLKYLLDQAQKAVDAGLSKHNIVIDPGIGFAKNFHQNLQLIKNAQKFIKTEYPVLYGTSRKRFIGEILKQKDPLKRTFGTIGSSMYLMQCGVEILRVHDAIEHLEMLKVFTACQEGTFDK